MSTTSPHGPGGVLGHPAVPYAAPFGVFILLLMADPWVGAALAPFVDPGWSYAVRAGVTAGVLAAFWPRYAAALPALGSGAGARGWAAAVGVGVLVFGLWIVLDRPWLTVGEPDGFDPTRNGRLHLGLVAARILGAALVVPVMEELFWRGFLMRWVHHPRFLAVDPRTVGWKALALSSVVFATEHRLWFAGLLAGLAYGELYRRTGDLRTAVVAHAITNALLGWWVVGTRAWEFW